MKILFCCEHFYPDSGGVAKVVQELGMEFVKLGHKIEVATTFSNQRKEDFFLEIKINSFKISGNKVVGYKGPTMLYQDFLLTSEYDLLFVMAAQQWTLDLLLPVIEKIKAKKIHIPCGYSSFYAPQFHLYYQQMRKQLKSFDHLIFFAENYRDIQLAREINHPNIHLIPGGASVQEFSLSVNNNIKNELKICNKDFVFLSIGAPAYQKGHKSLVKSYLKANLPFSSTLVLLGNYHRKTNTSATLRAKEFLLNILGRSPSNIMKLAKANKDTNKNIIFPQLNREQTVTMYHSANLFLFASQIEYSPLVIYECMAAGLPFLSVPVGNVRELASWSNGGEICPAEINEIGRTMVDVEVFARQMEDLSQNADRLKKYAIDGKIAWLEKFTWEKVAAKISKLF